MRMADTFVISGLREKRSALAGQIVELRRQLDKLQADIFHLDMVFRLYGEEPQDIPTKGRMPVRSAFFGRNEITRRCYDLLREKGEISADDVTVRAMREKGLDPDADREQRIDFTRRILVSLHDLRRAGTVEKVGAGRGVRWKLAERAGAVVETDGLSAPPADSLSWTLPHEPGSEANDRRSKDYRIRAVSRRPYCRWAYIKDWWQWLA
jgi:hypothetical protein